MIADLRLGRYQDALDDVEVDLVCSDPPYSGRTHGGQEAKRTDGAEGLATDGLGYASWDWADVYEFVDFWSERNRGWFACMTDHVLAPAFEAAYQEAGLTTFPPIPCVMRGMSVRLAGDGPSSWTVWLMVARPKSLSKWGTLPGEYRTPPNRDGYPGGKPVSLMGAVIRDYSKPSDLVADPCAGFGSTLVAAVENNRRAVGSEIDPAVFARTQVRLGKGVTPDLFAGFAEVA